MTAFAVSLGLTLLLEVPFAYVWGLRSCHNMTVAVLVNILTNPVVVLLNILHVPILLLEAGAIAVEAVCYHTCGENIRRPLMLALCTNVFSYSVGLLLQAVF